MLTVGILLTVTACAPRATTGSARVEPAGSEPPSGDRFAPYVYLAAPRPNLVATMSDSPARRFVLSFALATDEQCEPSWGSRLPVDDPALRAELDGVRAAGGALTVATGGADGTYLENVCETPGELASAYRKVLSASGADQLDVDVETTIDVARVADALTMVSQDPGVGVTVTVEVLDARRGLGRSTLDLLNALAERGTDVTVNAMVMNFPPVTSWRDAMLATAETITGQIQEVWPGDRQDAYRRLGLTLMIGRNDTGQITTIQDAAAVREYATSQGIGFLGYWSLSRDNGGCPGQPVADDQCSGTVQSPFDFARTFG
jgi:chitinase